MQDAASPTRRRWFPFRLRDLSIVCLAIAATIVPMKLYERFYPPAQTVIFQTTVYQADSEKLRELAHDWSPGKLRVSSQEEVTAVVDSLKKRRGVVLSPPVLSYKQDRDRHFTGEPTSVLRMAMLGEKTATMIDVGIRLAASPAILRNGRICFDVESQHRTTVVGKVLSRGPQQIAFAAPDGPVDQPATKTHAMTIPAELAPGETMFLVDAGHQAEGKGTVIQVHVLGVK